MRHLRFRVAALLCLASTVNYLDRQTLSVLAETIQRELGLLATDYADITSAFLVSYTVMYLVGGRIVDLVGTRWSFLVFASAWSLATMAHGLAGTVRQFQAARLLLGATQPVNFPAGVRAVAEWFPMRERALGVGIFNAGTALGSTLAVPLVSAIALLVGWRWTFAVTGGLGFAWVAAWAALYRLPKDHPRLGEEERALIAEHREAAESGPAPRLAVLLRMKETWGCVAARALTDPVTYFLTFWVPLYLQKERGFSLAQLGAVGWVPFAAYFLGNLAAGAIPRALVGRGLRLDAARKRTMLAAALGNAVLLLALTRAGSPVVALACLTLVFFGHAAWGNIILPAEVFPSRAVGTVSGLGGCLGAATGVVTQQVIGHLAGAGAWAPLFLGCAAAYIAAQALVVALVGELG
ncbi:MAG TPA: MFS transporter, partial [Vicinamibacteria bacterium]|nr:MFS transporter [Vicinamibacteria bacterium]